MLRGLRHRVGVIAAPLLLALAGAGHPVHVSSTQVDLSSDQRALEVTMRVFTDDLEAALKTAGRPVSINGGGRADVDSALASYVLPRVTVAANETPVRRGRLIGHEREDDATLIFVEVPIPPALRSLRLTQSVLLELFEDQVNLVHFRAGSTKRSALLRRGTEVAAFRW